MLAAVINLGLDFLFIPYFGIRCSFVAFERIIKEEIAFFKVLFRI